MTIKHFIMLILLALTTICRAEIITHINGSYYLQAQALTRQAQGLALSIASDDTENNYNSQLGHKNWCIGGSLYFAETNPFDWELPINYGVCGGIYSNQFQFSSHTDYEIAFQQAYIGLKALRRNVFNHDSFFNFAVSAGTTWFNVVSDYDYAAGSDLGYFLGIDAALGVDNITYGVGLQYSYYPNEQIHSLIPSLNLGYQTSFFK